MTDVSKVTEGTEVTEVHMQAFKDLLIKIIESDINHVYNHDNTNKRHPFTIVHNQDNRNQESELLQMDTVKYILKLDNIDDMNKHYEALLFIIKTLESLDRKYADMINSYATLKKYE